MADESGFTINKAYAEKYNRWREKEELQKLKDKYGDVDVDEDSSSSETEDEDAEGLTASLEKGWLRALSAIKSKDPKIYDSSTTFYNEEEDPEEGTSSSQSKKNVKPKPMFLKDYDRKVILEKGGMLSDESDDSDDNEEKQRFHGDPSYFEEQENIKRSIKEALPDSDSDDEFLTRREKSKEEQQEEENEYVNWLKGQKEELTKGKEVGIELKPLKNYWGNPSLGDDEKFLRDYILNKEFLEEDDDRIPSYHEIVDEDVSDEDQELEKQEDFERKYNFRFEEPDPEFIKSYPRTMGDSVRKKKDKRAKKREEVRERKRKEKEKKMEELKQLKNLKKKEIFSKLDRLKEITGDLDLGFTENDIEKDFDPKEHDKLMEQVFNEDYYDNDEDESKPVFSDDDDLGIEETWDKWSGPSTSHTATRDSENEEDADSHEDDGNDEEDLNMDADYDPSQEDRSFGLDGGRSKKKKKSKFAQALERRKPLFNPDEKTFEEYFDEYYKLDYEDIIGDQPCRFKYRSVPANDFGLSTDEVMACPDRELNAWVSLRKMSQYRTEEEEEFDKRSYHRRSKNETKKQQILASLAESAEMDDEEDETAAETKSKKKHKRKRKKSKGAAAQEIKQEPSSDTSSSPKKTGKNKNKETLSKTTESSSPGKSPNKRKNTDGDMLEVVTKKKSKVPKDSSSTIKLETDNRAESKSDSSSPKKKKKDKKKGKGKSSGASGGKGFHVSAERLKAYGLDPKKFRYSHISQFNPKSEDS